MRSKNTVFLRNNDTPGVLVVGQTGRERIRYGDTLNCAVVSSPASVSDDNESNTKQ